MSQGRRVGWQDWEDHDVDWMATPDVSDDDPYRVLDEATTIPQIPVSPPQEATAVPDTPSLPRKWLVAVGLGVTVLSIMVGIAIGWLGGIPSEPAGKPVVIPTGPYDPDAPSNALPPALHGGGDPNQ